MNRGLRRRGRRGLPLPAKQLGDRLAGDRTDGEPVLEPRLVDAELHRLANGVVDAQLLDEASVARAAPIGGHHAIEGNLFSAGAGETNDYGHGWVGPRKTS